MIGISMLANRFPEPAIWLTRVLRADTVANSAATYSALKNINMDRTANATMNVIMMLRSSWLTSPLEAGRVEPIQSMTPRAALDQATAKNLARGKLATHR
jgi:hypothetical protein